MNRVQLSTCVLFHLVSCAIFVQYVPVHFAFGAVNLFINSWYCLPRIVLIGWEQQQDKDAREADGWDVVSVGLLAITSIIYAECLSCDWILRGLGGHAIYDSAVLVLSACYVQRLYCTTSCTCLDACGRNQLELDDMQMSPTSPSSYTISMQDFQLAHSLTPPLSPETPSPRSRHLTRDH